MYKIAWTNLALLIIQEDSSNKKILNFISQAKSLSQSKMCCQPCEREKVQHHQVGLDLLKTPQVGPNAKLDKQGTLPGQLPTIY